MRITERNKTQMRVIAVLPLTCQGPKSKGTNTTTTTMLRLSGFCPGLPKRAGTRRNIYPLTPILYLLPPSIAIHGILRSVYITRYQNTQCAFTIIEETCNIWFSVSVLFYSHLTCRTRCWVLNSVVPKGDFDACSMPIAVLNLFPYDFLLVLYSDLRSKWTYVIRHSKVSWSIILKKNNNNRKSHEVSIEPFSLICDVANKLVTWHRQETIRKWVTVYKVLRKV